MPELAVAATSVAATSVATTYEIAPSRATVGTTIAAIGTKVPANVVPNAPIAERIGVTAEWIVKRTGIRSRRFATAGERLSDIAANAGRTALERAGIDAADVDLVLVATTTSDELLPNAAPLVAQALMGGGGMTGTCPDDPGTVWPDRHDIPRERMLAVPLRRAGKPQQVAACVAFLASEHAGHVTGTTLAVDGGLTA